MTHAEKGAPGRGRVPVMVVALAGVAAAVLVVAGLPFISALPLVLAALVLVRLLRAAEGRAQRARSAVAGQERELRIETARFTALSHCISDAVFTADADGGLCSATPRMLEITGLSPAAIIGDGLWERIHPDDWASRLPGHVRHAQAGELITEGRLVQDDGSARWVRLAVAPVRLEEDAAPEEWVGVLEDATPEQRTQRFIARHEYQERFLAERLAHQERHDALTGLANRSWFRQRLVAAMEPDNNEAPERLVGVALIDLDSFRLVNDSLGHETGDALLLTVAERIARCIRSTDLAARLSGDEFALLLPDVDGTEQLESIARRILRSLAMPIMVRHREVLLTASVGLAAQVPDGSTVELLRDADLALEAARQTTGTFRWYEEGMHVSVVDRLELEHALREAIDQGQIASAYQPIVDLRSGEIRGSEALARWPHGLRGPVSPADFIPMAERLGLIGRLGGQMLRRAYRDVQPWATDDGLPMYVNVNVSAHQLAEPTFTESLLASLLTADFDPSRLVVELTESAFVDHEVEVIRILTRLREEGIKIAMDDFGTGYSSLASLRSLPLDVLKIDRSFINDLEHRPSDVSFVEAIVGLAHTLGLVVVAEGVETEEQREILLAAGCDRGQGWLFGKPVAAEDFYTLQLAEVPAA